MQTKDGQVLDRREMLRVKVKSLAAEAAIIRREERRTREKLREELALHRRTVVREAARNAHVAYGLVKGRAYEQMEGNAKSIPDWDEVTRMVKKYGAINCRVPEKPNPRINKAD